MPDNYHRQHYRRVNLSAFKQNAIREVTAHKRQAKKELQQLRKSGSSPEEVRLLAQKFHLLVRQHSKIVKEARQLTAKASAKQTRKECHRDIHKFARKILDEDNYTSIQPSFGQEQAEEYFSRVYSTTPKSFSHPEWMPECPQPSVPMTTAPFTEVRGVISSLKSSSARSPADQIPTPSSRGVPPCCLHCCTCITAAGPPRPSPLHGRLA